MNSEELKEALFSGCPVILDAPYVGDMHFKCVSAIIYRVHGGKLTITAELMDKCGNSVIICDPERLRLFKESEG